MPIICAKKDKSNNNTINNNKKRTKNNNRNIIKCRQHRMKLIQEIKQNIKNEAN